MRGPVHQSDNFGALTRHISRSLVMFECVTKISQNSPDYSQSESSAFDVLLTLQIIVD